MNGVAEPSGQRWTAQSLNRFHSGTITWPNKGWRISFSAKTLIAEVISLESFQLLALRHF